MTHSRTRGEDTSPITDDIAYGYLGPEATFTEAALLKLLESRREEHATRIAFSSVETVLREVASGKLAGAVVPMENSIEGGVPAPLDALSRVGDLRILGETIIPVRFVCAVRPGTRLEDIRDFATHPHGEAQTRAWVQRNLPQASYFPSLSTAAAARTLAGGTPDFQAALCPLMAAERYGLDTVARDISDRHDAMTRFVLVGKATQTGAPTGADKTTLVVTLSSDRAGALVEMLEQFSTRGVNLSRIESRPTGSSLGLYQFSLDAEGHISESRMSEALSGVHRVARRVVFLGSYPNATGDAVVVDPVTTDEAFIAAEEWLASL